MENDINLWPPHLHLHLHLYLHLHTFLVAYDFLFPAFQTLYLRSHLTAEGGVCGTYGTWH